MVQHFIHVTSFQVVSIIGTIPVLTSKGQLFCYHLDTEEFWDMVHFNDNFEPFELPCSYQELLNSVYISNASTDFVKVIGAIVLKYQGTPKADPKNKVGLELDNGTRWDVQRFLDLHTKINKGV